MKIRIENEYTDGHTSVREADVDVTEPADVSNEAAMDELRSELQQYVGDGHGAGRRDLGIACTITILRAQNIALVGKYEEWFDAPHSRG